MPQITSVTSESLQATVRRLLPSQVGFGEDLQAGALQISYTDSICGIQITDGVTTKNILRFAADAKADGGTVSYTQNLVVFLNSGDTLRAFSNNAANFLDGSARQIADISGNLINPTGYTGE